MQASPMLSISSSFSRFTCNDFGKTADRVVEEFRGESIDHNHDFASLCEQNPGIEIDESEDQLVEDSAEKELNCDEMKEEKEEIDKDEEVDEDEELEFEFPIIMSRSCSSPALADEIFCNGQIRPIYSFSFDNLQVDGGGAALPPVQPMMRQPLRSLFLQETDSIADLDALPSESYSIVGGRKTAEAIKEDGQCKKSKSAKSRWRFKNFLNRSNSEGGKREK